MSSVKAELHTELNDLLIERHQIVCSLKQWPIRDYSFIIACCAMTGWWLIAAGLILVWLQSIVGILMFLLTIPAIIIFAIIWNFRFADQGQNEEGYDPFDPVRRDRAAMKARLDEINKRVVVLRTLTAE